MKSSEVKESTGIMSAANSYFLFIH